MMLLAAVPLVAAMIAGLSARRLKAPGGPLLWSLAAAAAATLAFDLGPLPKAVGGAGQLMIGAIVGRELAGARLSDLRRYALPLLAGLLTLVVVSLVGGFVLAEMTPLSPRAALLATLPGGATDAVAFANETGSEGATVAVVHLTRQLLVVLVAAAALRRMLRR